MMIISRCISEQATNLDIMRRLLFMCILLGLQLHAADGQLSASMKRSLPDFIQLDMWEDETNSGESPEDLWTQPTKNHETTQKMASLSSLTQGSGTGSLESDSSVAMVHNGSPTISSISTKSDDGLLTGTTSTSRAHTPSQAVRSVSPPSVSRSTSASTKAAHGIESTHNGSPLAVPDFTDSAPSSISLIGNVTRPQKDEYKPGNGTTTTSSTTTVTRGFDQKEDDGGVGKTRYVIVDSPLAAATSSTETVTVSTLGEELSWIARRIESMIIIHGVGFPVGGLLVKTGFVGAAVAFHPQTIADQLGLVRGVFALAYSVSFSGHGDPTNLPWLNQNEGHNATKWYGAVPHTASTITLCFNLLENLEIAAVLGGVNKNQWEEKAWFWSQRRIFWTPVIFGIVTTGAIWWATADLVESTRSTMGNFKCGFGSGPAMAIFHGLIALVSVSIWARAVWRFWGNAKAQRDIEEFVEGAEEKEGEAVKEVVRSRWLAGLYTLNIVANMIVAAVALDDQGRPIAQWNFYLSIGGGIIGGLHLAITIDIVGRIAKCCRPANVEPVEEVELEEVQTRP